MGISWDELNRANSALAEKIARENGLSRKTRKKPVHWESKEQQKLFVKLRDSPEIPEFAFVFAVPNGVKLDGARKGMAVAEGLTEGVPDIVFPFARGGWFGMYMEMKYGRNTLSSSQKKFRDFLVSENYLHVVPYSCDEAWELALKYVALARTKRPC